MEKRNSQHEHGQPIVANKRLLFACVTRCGSVPIATPVSLLANEFEVRSILHWQVSLAVVNQICVIHEAMNDCKN